MAREEVADSEDEPFTSSPEKAPAKQGDAAIATAPRDASRVVASPRDEVNEIALGTSPKCNKSSGITQPGAAVDDRPSQDGSITSVPLVNHQLAPSDPSPTVEESSSPYSAPDASNAAETGEARAGDPPDSPPDASHSTATAPLSMDLSKPTEIREAVSESMPPATARTPQESTLAELKAQRAALIASLAALDNVQELVAEDENSDLMCQLSVTEPTDSDITTAANKIVQKHIKLLHEYNEIKDIGQGLMGLIADSRGVRIVEVQDEFGVDAKD